MNTLLQTLQTRFSVPANQLSDPAPDKAQLDDILRCAVSAPDHGRLRPWRFIVIQADARHALAEVFVKAATIREPDVSEQQLARLREKPLRAPMIVVIVATLTSDHPKVPEIEQILSAGAAVQLMQLGANALGFGAVWLTGANAFDPNVKDALGVAQKDEIVGFLHIGTPTSDTAVRHRAEVADHVSEWRGS